MKKDLLRLNTASVLILLWLICPIVLIMPIFRWHNIVHSRILRTCTSYEGAINEAIKDINKGEKYIFLTGFLEINDEEEKEMMNLQELYHFKYISLGCMGRNRYNWAYEQIVRRAINEKAGKCVFRTSDKYTIVEILKQKRAVDGYLEK